MKKNDSEVKINTLIGEGTELAGDFTIKGSARVDGKIDGNVNAEGTLILGAAGEINGDVTADAVLIGGAVFGNIHASKKTELMKSARVIGDITTTLIVIDEHAIFQGGCNMNQTVPDKKAKTHNAKAVKEGRKSAKAALEEALKEVKEAENNETPDTAAVEEKTQDEFKFEGNL